MSLTSSLDLIGRASGGRKLIAVVYADMVGYSRLIELDDIGTFERLRSLRSTLIDPAINVHGGRIVQTGGDSLLVVFDSIDGAVRCAVHIQRQVPDYDGDRPPDRCIRFRIGVNIGDVIADGTNLHGDGVNVAARLQAECPPGGICVSRAVRDHTHGRLDLTFDELGVLSLKNITRPVEAFVLRREPETAAVAPLPSPTIRTAKPPRLSVIVAPLRNLSTSEGQEYLVEAITEDFTTELSRLPGSFVVGGGETLRRRGASVDPRELARKLDVAYVIQGSIRGTVDRLDLNLQLIDTETGAHLWAQRFDIDLGSSADARNELTSRLVRALSAKLTEDVNRRIEAIPLADWTPYDLVMRGRALASRPFSAANRYDAMTCFEQALDRAPGAVGARIGVAGVLVSNIVDRWSQSFERDEARAEQLLIEILRDDDDNPEAHAYMGMLRRIQGRLSDARIELEIAIGLAPNNVNAIGQFGIVLAHMGQPEAAIPHIERCLRLAPHDRNTPGNQAFLGLCELLLGRIEEAVIFLRRARAGNPRLYYIHLLLAAALALRGELDEAGDALRQAVETKPDLCSQPELQAFLRECSPQYVKLYRKTVYAGLLLAGLPQAVPNFAALPDE